MKNVYNTIDKTFENIAEKLTALNVADALYYGSATSYAACDAGVSLERFNEVKKIVFYMMAEG